MQGTDGQPSPLIRRQQALRQLTHHRSRQGHQLTPEQRAPQPPHLVIHLDRSPQHRLHIHQPRGTGGIPAVPTSPALSRPGTTRSQNTVGHGTGSFLGLGGGFAEGKPATLRSSTDPFEGGMNNHPKLSGLQRGTLSPTAGHHTGPQVLVVKAVTDQKFVEAADRLQQGPVQNPLPKTTIRTAAEAAEGSIPP